MSSKFTWDNFELYQRCPQCYMWSEVSLVKKVTNPPLKDTQHLIRGNASQAMVTRWVKEEVWKESNKFVLEDFVRQNCKEEVSRAWMENLETGERSEASVLDITVLIQNNLLKCLPLLRESLDRQLGLENLILIPEYEVVVSLEGYDLFARLDLLAYNQEKFIIYEGKATRKPKFRTDDQVRWQLELIKEKGTFCTPAAVHYYLFYEIHKLREVVYLKECEVCKEHKEWIEYRNIILQRMMRGEYFPTPTKAGCHICRYRYFCDSSYKEEVKNKFLPSTLKIKRKVLI